MPNFVVEAPVDTALGVESKVPGKVSINRSVPWTVWFHSVVAALFRPQVSAVLNFPNTPAGTSSDLTVVFTAGTVALGDFAIVAPPVGSVAANSMYTAYVSAVDQVTVRFNNYSAGAINPASGTFLITVIKQ